jgi:hypothetical protein
MSSNFSTVFTYSKQDLGWNRERVRERDFERKRLREKDEEAVK